jgi:creatinine amidohydrolase
MIPVMREPTIFARPRVAFVALRQTARVQRGLSRIPQFSLHIFYWPSHSCLFVFIRGFATPFHLGTQSDKVTRFTMELTDLTAPEVRSLSKDTPVVFPVAALEQHGQHMPHFTDSLLLGEVVRRAKEKLHDQVLFAPLMWLGNSHHHLDFSGTLSASPRTYLEMLSDLAENFIHHGFRRIVFINGHGGNDVPGRQATFELRQKHRDRSDLLLLFGTYWLLGSRPKEIDGSLAQPQMGHACEWETSMILRLKPDLVREWKNLAPVPFGNSFEPAHRAWVTQDRTAPGHIGSPHLATAEKGESLFRIFATDVIALLNRVLKWDGKSWEG